MKHSNEANEADLVAILKAGKVRESAATKRKKAIERAEQTIDARTSAMRERGETVTDIAARDRTQ